ncbi:FAD:protein FMN transferase [Methylococcaceae bacterium]|jgi:thiamine biosynthesis lipoprotein|nr:FAD:protein FMN transferase [Methylococcaceae bacterium]
MRFSHYPFSAMGSPCELQFYAENEVVAQKVAQKIISDIKRLECKYSRYRSDSFLSKINQVAALGGSLSIDEETAGLLNYAQTCYALSDGLFDITSGILRQAWQFDTLVLPDDKIIQSLLKKIGWQKLQVENSILSFLQAEMELDFGGIVKEYAADRASILCLNAGILHGIINLGGDIKIIGAHPDGKPWRVGIQHPRDKTKIWKVVKLKRGALASSGDYERCMVIDGVRYGHILNPKTGYPVRHLAAVSVVADLCVVAGSAATIAILKEKEGEKWLKSLGLQNYTFPQF